MRGFDGYVLGGDLGSGSCKVAALKGDGRIIAERSVPYDAAYPAPGWIEQDPDLWYRAFRDAAQAVMASIPAEAERDLKSYNS